MSDPNGIITNNPIPINDDNSEVDKMKYKKRGTIE